MTDLEHLQTGYDKGFHCHESLHFEVNLEFKVCPSKVIECLSISFSQKREVHWNSN